MPRVCVLTSTSSKASSPIELTFAGMVSAPPTFECSNDERPSAVSDDGRLTLVRAEARWNAHPPIDVMPSPRVTEVGPVVQYTKA